MFGLKNQEQILLEDKDFLIRCWKQQSLGFKKRKVEETWNWLIGLKRNILRLPKILGSELYLPTNTGKMVEKWFF